MSRHNAVRGVLHNFLGTYTSRYSAYKGYWLFGFVVPKVPTWSVDLLGADDPQGKPTPRRFAERLARRRFEEQMAKAGLPISQVAEARLDVQRGADVVVRAVNGRDRTGRDVRFEVRTITSAGRTFSASTTVFVAPHSCWRERRSVSRA